MTPRLKFLSFLLGLSLIYAVYDYIDRSSNNSKNERTNRKKYKRARTAGATSNSAKIKKSRARAAKKETLKNNNRKDIKLQENQFSVISDEFNNLEGWSRNPFVKFQDPKKIVIKKEPNDITQNQKIEEPTNQAFELNALDKLNIETAVSMGDRAFVTINGKTYREGDLIDDALIEKIENEQVTFRVGTTTIIKNVGI